MARNTQDEQYDMKFIPENFETGINLFGMNFAVRNFIEGIIFGTIGIVIFYIITGLFFSKWGTRVGVTIALGLGLMVLCIRGINDEPITVFISNMLKQKRNRIFSYRDPDAKILVKPYVTTLADKNDKAPQEQLLGVFNKLKKRASAKRSEQEMIFQSQNYYNADQIYFRDEGMTGKSKPVEYMTKKELKEYQKKQAKLDKEMKKFAKKAQMDKEAHKWERKK